MTIYIDEKITHDIVPRRKRKKIEPILAGCDHCDDGDGVCIFPYYGVAPHICFYKLGRNIGQSIFLPEVIWPNNFRPDRVADERSNCGVYTHCLNCGAGEKKTFKDQQ